MRVGDLVTYVRNPSGTDLAVGIVVDWYVIYDRFGDPVDKLAVVNWQHGGAPENEYPDMLEVINKNVRYVNQ